MHAMSLRYLVPSRSTSESVEKRCISGPAAKYVIKPIATP